MEQIIQITTLIALITFIILAFFAISALVSAKSTLQSTERNFDRLSTEFSKFQNKVERSLDDVQTLKPKIERALDDISDIKNKSVETLSNTDNLSVELTALTKNINHRVDEVSGTIEPFKGMMNNFYRKVSPPVNQTASFVSAIYKFMTVFASKLK